MYKIETLNCWTFQKDFKGSAYENDVMMTDLPKKISLFHVVQVKGVL